MQPNDMGQLDRWELGVQPSDGTEENTVPMSSCLGMQCPVAASRTEGGGS